MRVLKFRAWDVEFKKWQDKVSIWPDGNITACLPFDELGTLRIDGYKERIIICQATGLKDRNGKEIYEERIIICQATGLKDRNGKEIYEGDIVKYLSSSDGNTYCVPIEYYRGCFCAGGIFTNLIGIDDNDPLILKTGYNKPYMCEIIGNIYEHPHLLNERKDA